MFLLFHPQRHRTKGKGEITQQLPFSITSPTALYMLECIASVEEFSAIKQENFSGLLTDTGQMALRLISTISERGLSTGLVVAFMMLYPQEAFQATLPVTTYSHCHIETWFNTPGVSRQSLHNKAQSSTCLI